MKVNASPESFMIRDKDFSIVSCSPETLIEKKGLKIITKPIAGTLKKTKISSKSDALFDTEGVDWKGSNYGNFMCPYSNAKQVRSGSKS